MKKAIIASLVLALAGWVTAAKAEPPPLEFAGLVYDLQICEGEYALCAASTCTPTGHKIAVNVQGGGTALFDEAACTCPIYKGPALADPDGGNMQGTCKPPGPNQVWSLYSPKTNVPQQINNWKLNQQATEVEFQECADTDGVGGTFANCFSFACTIDAHHPVGVPTATCYCPLGENPDGSAVAADTEVFTPAGQCNTDICYDHPVGAAFAGANDQGNQCLGQVTNSGPTLP